MAGRINEDDIASVRERVRIDDVVGEYVALRNAGGGSQKGLCPFHDEKTPSFTVTPSRGFYYCFGCGEGGDVITFLQRQQNLSFTEAIQVLADRVGIVLRVTDDGTGPGQPPGRRKRILEANQAAEEFFAAQLETPEGVAGRQFLDGRGFDRAAALHFRVGYAPKHGRALGQTLRAKGFDDATLKAAGLVRDNGWDFFSGRVLWPIRDSAQSVLGFGARRIHDDDRLPAKYINTPETPVYKKSHVLYGLDLARQSIGKRSQAVIVEGYTDVMAAHLSGVDTAVASCGTAFGDDHARLLQRLMGTRDGLHGEVIFTFDGDDAGQKAALKVFKGDQNFIAQTYVAVEPTGLDPCDLRLEHGEAAVRELVGRRVPLYRFVMANVLEGYDLDRADARLSALRECAGLVSSIRDGSLVSQYLRELAGMLGMDIEDVRREVSSRQRGGPSPSEAPPEESFRDGDVGWPNPDDRSLRLERDTLKLMLQHPLTFDAAWNGVVEGDFTHPGYAAVFRVISATPLADGWVERLRSAAPNELVTQLLVALLVEPLVREASENYSLAHSSRLQLARVVREIADCKSKLQRTDPVKEPTAHRSQFAELTQLEMQRKQLLVASAGE
ncbi:DNA primase [Tessaracoccus rhinocerotis]|uniref:DNA primase n=1 Tax=Tessaracoccus rhinocerotis TaxID=1689449 RepID=A0A553K469_9ACTN|nr:DNA primase [Tessaracoccus rhinocerotis]TRY19492.1 DNA primase [Tessaracoccus rhinocerotis]